MTDKRPLAELGKRSRFPSEPPTSPRTSQAIAARLVRNWAACSVEDQRLIEALALRLRTSVG